MSLIDGRHVTGNSEEILVTGGGDGAVRLWTLEAEHHGRLTLLASLEDPKDESESVLTITIDRSFLASGHVGGEIRVWDLETKQLMRILHHYDQDILSLTVGYGMLFSADVAGRIRVRLA